MRIPIDVACPFIFTAAALLMLHPVEAFAQSFHGTGQIPSSVAAPYVTGIAADGGTVVGYGSSELHEVFRWTVGGGIEVLFSDANPDSPWPGISGDGETIVAGAYRWDAAGGLTEIKNYDCPACPPADHYYASGISYDAGLISGHLCSIALPGACAGWTWSSSGGWAGNSDLHGRVSGDGTTWVVIDAVGGVSLFGRSTPGLAPLPGDLSMSIAGLSHTGDVAVGCSGFGPFNGRAYRWDTASESTVALGDLPGGGTASCAFDTTVDGRVAVGFATDTSGETAMIWDVQNGMQSLAALLDAEGIDYGDWVLRDAIAISDDGLRITGNGLNPDGDPEGFVVTLVGAMKVPSMRLVALTLLFLSLVIAGVVVSRSSALPADDWSQ